MAQVEMTGFWTNWNGEGDDLVPGQKVELPDDIAASAVASGTARYAGKQKTPEPPAAEE